MVAVLADLVQRGGKRLRPALTIASYRACSVGSAEGTSSREIPSEKALLDAACAWEFLQLYFLVQDDWMDGDVTRRGGPAVHVKLTEFHNGDRHLGACGAVLAGDLACAFAHQVLVGIDAPADLVREALVLFSRVHRDVILGQSLDLALPGDEPKWLDRLHALKTGSYTVQGPVELGAILARAPSELRRRLKRFSYALGLAFQLRDDVLGTFGDPTKTGKPVGSDLRNRKRTSLVVEAIERAGVGESARLERIMSTEKTDGAEIGWAVEFMRSCGALDAVEERIAMLCNDSKAVLVDAPITPEGAEQLGGLADLLSHRDA